MTSVSPESHTGELGVSFMQLLCGASKVIFRPIQLFDVGIDGLIEPQVENVATGAFIGVQIKAGPSFRRSGDSKYVFRSDRAHFEYWSRCTLPVVGVVYDPETQKAVWTNLSDFASRALSTNGPWSVNLSLECDELRAETLSNLISSAEFTRINRRFEDSMSATMIQHEGNKQIKNVSVNKKLAWEELFETFLSLLHDEWTVADAGYRLSWYFPMEENDPRRVFALARLAQVSDVQLFKIISAMERVQEDNADPVAEHLCYIIGYVQNVIERLEEAVVQGRLREGSEWVAIQAIELIGEDQREDLWAKCSA
ncbi:MULTISPECIES: DUF4365 domain-containing protein [unclassified Pseudoalteromonas]|uniref:DUF4365 domain-containing protein n=1 Tax=unclassified Pseudoalteromonas TaxID=194690 RepID=UPI0020982FF9|nr:DUF4365 domain-containing protein [Pseudoalteromonas sp. XMcav2-N]MCO7189928.1 DUF4365 domain-containing protein [Pseudoalteromonas sp. XMcav2-N]